ncbi:hypothetical protein KBI33_00180 [Candidatus Shapirobacteria bacterium]|nr:hypothetical protein [Candidatus Shapirobacteria bacterium]
MILNTYSHSSSGQSLVEVVVTVAIATLILVALVAGATVAVRNIQYSRNRARAVALNRQATEWLRSERAKGWSAFYSRLAEGNYCLNTLDLSRHRNCNSNELVDGVFKREANVAKEGLDKIIITVTTFWTDSQGEHREEVKTYLTRW